MDDKYIENLGMSANVDEGLWDRLKSRASGFKQAAQNLSGTGVGENESAKFNSIFKSFIKKSVQTIEDLIHVLQPYVQAGKLSPEQTAQLQQFSDASVALQQVENLPLSEANLFTRPFSSLGAIATGNPDKILDAYKAQIDGHYQSFLKDAQRLNIVPANYIPRKVASISPAVPEAMQKLGRALGKQLVGAPATASRPMPTGALPPSAPTTPPAAPTPPAPAPEAPVAPVSSPVPSPVPPTAQKADTSPEPESSMLAPMAKAATAEPEKPAVVAPVAVSPEPVKPEEPKAASTGDESGSGDAAVYALIEKAVEKINDNLRSTDPSSEKEGRVATSPMLDDIQSYTVRDAWKALVPFPPSPAVVVKTPEWKLEWKLRYKPEKDAHGHTIQFLWEIENLKTGEKKAPSNWQTLLTFSPTDVINKDTLGPRTTFDVFKKIAETNPKLGTIIQQKMPTSSKAETLKRDAIGSLRNLTHATRSSSAERGLRKLSNNPEEEGGTSIEKATETPPLGGPERPEPQEKPAPERRSRTVQSKPSSPKAAAKSDAKPVAAKKPEVKKPEAPKAAAKPASKPSPKKEEPPKAAEPEKPTAVGSKTIPKEKYADYLKAKATKEKNLEEGVIPGLKDFFSL